MWNGLSYYDRRQDMFVTITSFSTIENKGITNIVEDSRGKIWITTNNTVLSFTMNEAHVLENINYYAVANDMETFRSIARPVVGWPKGGSCSEVRTGYEVSW